MNLSPGFSLRKVAYTGSIPYVLELIIKQERCLTPHNNWTYRTQDMNVLPGGRTKISKAILSKLNEPISTEIQPIETEKIVHC